MRDDIESVVGRLQDATHREWYRAQCGRATALREQLHSLVGLTGLPLWRPRHPSNNARPDVVLSFQVQNHMSEEFVVGYRGSLSASALTNAYSIHYNAKIENSVHKAMRLEPYLKAESDLPMLSTWCSIEDIVVPELTALGWRRLTEVEQWEPCPLLRYGAESRLLKGTVTVGSALTVDINGWLDDEPVTPAPEFPPAVVPLRTAVETLYDASAADRIGEVAQQTPTWVGEIEQILERYAPAGGVERLAPSMYPSVSWTVDFGEVRNGNFHARFFTDLHVSKLAPVWYWGDRFAVANAHPDAAQPELSGWTYGEISYLRSQTAMVKELTAALSARGFTHLDEWQLFFHFPAPVALSGTREHAMTTELLFRDPLGLCPPAPRIEEEHPNRIIRPRASRLHPRMELT